MNSEKNGESWVFKDVINWEGENMKIETVKEAIVNYLLSLKAQALRESGRTIITVNPIRFFIDYGVNQSFMSIQMGVPYSTLVKALASLQKEGRVTGLKDSHHSVVWKLKGD